MAINLENLTAAFADANETVQELKSTSRQELIPTSEIVAAEFNPYNENDSAENVEQLAKSIEAYGLIEPLCVNKGSDGLYHLISGERRFKAILRLNWKSVPCVVYDELEAIQAELRLHEANLETREYTSAQKFSFYKRVKELLEDLKDNGKLSGGLQKNIADMLHISERQVRKYDSISKLPDEIQQSVMEGDMTINRAYNLSQDYKSMTEEITQQAVDDISDEDQGNDDDNIDSEYSDGGFSPSEVFNGEMPDCEKAESEIIEEENEDNADKKLCDTIDEIARRKHLEEAILSYYVAEEIFEYYISHLPTSQEAIKEKLKPRGGFSFRYNGKLEVTLNNYSFMLDANGETDAFKYSEVDSCIRDMIRSGRLLSKEKHMKLKKLLNNFFNEEE